MKRGTELEEWGGERGASERARERRGKRERGREAEEERKKRVDFIRSNKMSYAF